ncbi:MAG: lipase [Burkholderiales bacterium RIFCSPLOWO2_02_FULL_57_36]|nr:MAG: lipase [Burkholderiales bacterium RIFCSPLOWO2_02_FULL_57_36]
MVARFSFILLVLQLLAVAAIVGFGIYAWKGDNLVLVLVLGISAVLMVRLLITANNFFITWLYRSETPEALRITWPQACRLFLGELGATMFSSSWTMAFHRFSKRAMKRPVGLPVLLIHGYGCNSGYWHPMSKALTKARIAHYAIDLEPVLHDIDGYVPLIHRAVETVCAETGHEKIVMVAHSMGGLAARAYLRDHGSRHIAKVITLGSPHQGTGLANFGAGLNSRQMRWTGNAKTGTPSEWLRTLAETENDAIRALFVSIYSHHDNIVSPQTSSHLQGATNIEFNGIGHVALGFHPAIQKCVIEEVLSTAKLQSAMPMLKSA